MAQFEPAYEMMLQREGGYVLTDTPGDKGGKTFAGISQRSHPDWVGWDWWLSGAADTTSPELRALVKALYRTSYWEQIEGDNIPSQEVANAIFSCAVLTGTKRAIKVLQRCIDRRLKRDGILGGDTRKAVARLSAASAAWETVQLRVFRERVRYYSKIVKRDKSQAKFLHGWINRALKDSDQ